MIFLISFNLPNLLNKQQYIDKAKPAMKRKVRVKGLTEEAGLPCWEYFIGAQFLFLVKEMAPKDPSFYGGIDGQLLAALRTMLRSSCKCTDTGAWPSKILRTLE
jgi:hypothetical protein